MLLTTEDLLKIQTLIRGEIAPVKEDISDIKSKIEEIDDRLIHVQNAVVRLENKQEEDYAFLSLQIIDINRHLGLNK